MPKQSQYEPNQTQPVVSLPALPALSAVEGSAVEGSEAEGVEPISKIFLTPFFGVFSTIFLILTDILPSFTDIDPFSSIHTQSGQSIQGRQFNPIAKNKNLPISINLKKLCYQAC